MKFTSKYFIILTSLFMGVALLIAPSAFAATVYFGGDSNTAAVGDTVSAEVRLNTENAVVNVVEGEISLGANASAISVREISDAGSVLTLWSRKPSLSSDGTKIYFAGGVPNGFKQTDALLFKIYFKVLRPANLQLSPFGVVAYKNDGQGSALSADPKSATFVLTEASPAHQVVDVLRREVAADNLPPEFLAATVGHDPSMFDDQLYLAIHASDYQSGIEYYAVKEGDLPTVRTGSEYVLRDQSQQSTLIIDAYDRAGNVRTLVINPAPVNRTYSRLVELLLLLIVLAATLKIIRLFKQRKESNK